MAESTAAILNLGDAATLLRFTRSITPHTSEQTLHVYEHKTSFSVHGHAHTSLAARLLPDLPATADLPSNPPLPTCALDPRTARDLVRCGLAEGHRVTIWNVSNDGRVNARLSGSPGNPDTLEEFLGETVADGAVLSVRVATNRSQLCMGVAIWDATACTLRVGETLEDDSFSRFEAILVSSHAREALICESDMSSFDMAKIADVSQRCGVALTTHPRKAFAATDFPADLERLVGSRHSIAPFLENKNASSAAAGILQYLQLMSDPGHEGRVKLLGIPLGQFMQLDNAAVRALNILPYPGDGGKAASLYGLLNCTKSAMGARLLKRWLSQPLQDVNDINKRLDVVSVFVEAGEIRRCVRDEHMDKMPDINLLCRRFTKNNGSKASLQDVVRLYQCAIRLPFLADELERQDLMIPRFAAPLRKLIAELANFEALVETTIDLDQIDNGEFVVSPKVDSELQELRGRQDAVLVKIDEEYHRVQSAIPGLKAETLKLERKDNLGYIFRLTRKDEKLIRGKKEFSVLETRKDGVRFQSRGLRRLSDSYKAIADEYQDKEAEMRGKTLEVASTYAEVFLDVSSLLAEVDVLASFATIAVQSRSPYTRPKLKEAGTGLVLKQARHPIVEENMSDESEYIANDLNLQRASEADSRGVDGGSLLIVTGPNMGGKSTYIRSAGVLTLMAHIGAFVPAHDAQVPITDRIFARVGASDNQHRAISTFMSEMLETAGILKSATPHSLVIIDELGRGTGTMDGYGLAYAISKHIATKIKSACLFATHFFELTALSEDIPSARNVHVSAVTDSRRNKLTFLYEVQHGACDQSFGVHVAEMAHFPTCVVDAAKRKADELEGFGAPWKKLKTCTVSDEERAAGQKVISNFLEQVQKLPLRTTEESGRSVAAARAMRQRMIAEKNRYVRALISGN